MKVILLQMKEHDIIIGFIDEECSTMWELIYMEKAIRQYELHRLWSIDTIQHHKSPFCYIKVTTKGGLEHKITTREVNTLMYKILKSN
jgi:hypothetical protein